MVDSIFDEGADEVGGEIEAYCPSPRCKADTTHTIISMYEAEVRRVQCVVCGEVHAYRKPRGETYDEPIQPPLRKKLARKPTWEEAMAQVTEADLKNCRPYSIRDTYEELDIVSHPKFDVGFVTELLPDNKVEITFKDEKRVLVHNRGDLAGKMPAISEMPAPRETKSRRRKRKKKGPKSELAKKFAAGNTVPEAELGKEDMKRALEQAEKARQAAAQKLAEEKRKLAKKLAVESIKAKRDDAPTRKAPSKRKKKRKKPPKPKKVGFPRISKKLKAPKEDPDERAARLEREKKEKAAERRRKAAERRQRRTGGKKSIRRTGGKKTIPSRKKR